ncbi:MAG: hypothetical protein GXP10_02305, partial [Gammaproteobacteria bacterium]|nr:hypothetical protein [Gammaproteobacteria bacterium]
TDGGRQCYFGVYPALVTDLVDPDELGRVEVRFPWLGEQGDSDVRAWATLISPYADDDQGFQALPEVDSQVVVAFEAGNLRRPYIVGACWNGQERMPVDPEQANNRRIIKTRSGSELEFDDSEGAAKVTLKLSSGHELVLDDGASSVTLTHASGHVITFTAGGAIEIQANSSVDITAPAGLNVDAPIATFSGIVKCTTMIASAGVVSPSYTPGAGNVW